MPFFVRCYLCHRFCMAWKSFGEPVDLVPVPPESLVKLPEATASVLQASVSLYVRENHCTKNLQVLWGRMVTQSLWRP